MYTVYKHTAPNGKCYIGMTRQVPEDRWQNGLGYRTQTRFYRAIVKYGWCNFQHEIVGNNLSLEQAEDLERRLIAEYRSWDKDYGYNIERGGNCRKEISPETREKLQRIHATEEYRAKIIAANNRRWSNPEAHRHMSELFSGERNPQYGKKLSAERKAALLTASRNAKRTPRTGENSSFYGKHHTEEAKRKISESRIGAKNGRARTVLCVETGISYGSIRDAYRETGVNFSSISKCCLGVATTAGGYHWVYLEEV